MRSDYTWLQDFERRDTLLWEVPDRLARIQQRSKTEWFNIIDTDEAVNTLRELAQGNNPGGLQAVVLSDSHLLVFSLGGPWYAPHKRWLIEQFFARIGPGDEAQAYEALELLAEDTQASHIIMATALARHDEALGRVYERYGFAKQSSQYVKEARWQHLALSSPD